MEQEERATSTNSKAGEEARLRKLRQEVPIVTIHGYKGSVLKRNGTVVWITAAQVCSVDFSEPSGIFLLTRRRQQA